jgi:undecaprenyl-diphosphatase
MIDTIDHNTIIYLHSIHTDFFDNFFLILTQIGNANAVIIITASFLSWFWIKNQRYNFWLLLVVVAGSNLVAQILKVIVVRPRPDLALYKLDSFSFPSGHATSAMALYGVFVYLIYKNFKPGWKRTITMVFCGLMILLIGFSRSYLGFHYPSDVLAGYTLGAIWLWMSVLFIRKDTK